MSTTKPHTVINYKASLPDYRPGVRGNTLAIPLAHMRWNADERRLELRAGKTMSGRYVWVPVTGPVTEEYRA